MRSIARTLLLLALALAGSPAGAQLPPDAPWRTFDTEHFRVTFPDGLEPTARRAAARAEAAYGVLRDELVEPPRGRIDLVLADNIDLANGYATPIPTNRVVIYAHPPVAEPSLAFYEDWLQLIIVHELVHIFHLDRVEGIWERLRSVFGRNPLLFPQALTPGWVVEGLATAYESRLTRSGRVHGTVHDMILRTAILEDAFFSIDRATAEPIRWPGGSTRYVYGSLFFHHLAERHGPERVSAFIRDYGGRVIPYRVNAAAREAFGISFSRAWREWEEDLRAEYLALAEELRAAGLTQPELLTSHGRVASHPRHSPNGAAIAYTAATGTEEPALRLILPDGALVDLERRTTAGPASWFPDGSRLLTAQVDFVDPYRIYSDLHRVAVDRSDERLTRAARVWEPDVHPDARRAVGVGNAGGTNVLVLHDLESGATRPITEPSLDVHWALPRWSPAGDRIAVSRWTRGGLYDVVLVDSSGAVLRELTSDRAIDAAPAWSPDGRYVVFSSDRTGIPNLYGYDLETGGLFQITNVLTGATQPDVSPDGRWIAFSLYGADGYDIARIRFDPAGWPAARPVPEELRVPLPPLGPEGAAGGPVRRYSPLPTVLPAAWSLILEGGTELGVGVGAAAFGTDVVERHAWSAQAALFPSERRLAAGAVYRYRGLGTPVLDVSASQRWRVRSAAGEVVLGGDTIDSAILGRERELAGTLTWLWRRWRSSTWLEAGAEIHDLDDVWERPEAADPVHLVQLPADLGATVTVGYTSARGYAFSLGPQEGITVAGTVEGHRFTSAFALDPDARGYTRLTGRGRAFHDLPLPGFARHVLAFRLDGGLDAGSRSPGFSIGGASGGTAPVPFDVDLLGGGLRFPVRGYPPGVQAGNRALSATGEYRFPIALVERGIGLVPLSLGRVWGDLFADAAAAWCGTASGACATRLGAAPTSPDPIYSVGAELIAHVRFGFVADLPLRVGAALPLSADRDGRPVVYLRLGRSF